MKKILVGCEESQAVTIELRGVGLEAYSCDILESSGGHPEWHIKDDIFNVIKSEKWSALIAFPPCTDLALSGSRWFEEKRADGRQQKSISFFMGLVNCGIEKIAIENPLGIMSSHYRKPDQVINPYDFGDAARKPTCLWLKNLPKLKATNWGDAPLFGSYLDKGETHTTKSGKNIPKWYNLPPSEDRAKIRSKTFPGIAAAMAKQWAKYL